MQKHIHCYVGEYKRLQNCNVISIDIGVKNLAIRFEQRKNGIITPYLFENISICPGEAKWSAQVYRNLIKYLSTRKDYFKVCDIIIVEGQHFINRIATILMFCIVTWITCTCTIPHLCVLQISPKMKGLLFPEVSGRAIKGASSSYARKLLIQRGDFESLEIMDKSSKTDDLADCICMIHVLLDRVDLH